MSNITSLTDTNFNEEVIQQGISLVMVSTKWCSPCQTLKPKLEALITRDHPAVKFCYMDAELCPDTANQFVIRKVPTLILFNNGLEIGKLTDVTDINAIGSWLTEGVINNG